MTGYSGHLQDFYCIYGIGCRRKGGGNPIDTLRSFVELGLLVIRRVPEIAYTPGLAILFWLIAGLVFMQYARVANQERQLYGMVKNSPGRQMVIATLYGVLGGIFASLLLTFIGISLSNSGIIYLLPLAFLLYAINPRFMCFSYAGGLVSLSHLLLGWPDVSVPAIMALVAVLHITESILIYFSGASCVTPLMIRNSQRQVVGGYSMQRFWPVPLVVLMVAFVPNLSEVSGAVAMPDWWPLIASLPDRVPDHYQSIYTLGPVMAVLGYSDLAVGASPRAKSHLTASYLAVYSVVLLVLSVLSAQIPIYVWAAVLFGPLGHELVIHLSNHKELSTPYRPSQGVQVLDVMPRSPAYQAGLRMGDEILAVEETSVSSRGHLYAALTELPAPWRVQVVREEQLFTVLLRHQRGPAGLILAPEPGDQPNVDVRRSSRLVRWLRKVRRQ